MKPEVVDAVRRRDGGCAAPRIDPRAGPCFDEWGRLMARTAWWLCELDHYDYTGRYDARPLVKAEQVVMVCPGHHRGTGPQRGRAWATAHRAEIKAYALSARVPFREESGGSIT